MRRKSSIDPSYFETLYAGNADPWEFETSDYEQAKYRQTIAKLPQEHFLNALEIGCANGILTVQLADRCGRLIAVDVVDRVIAAAKQRCAALTNVTIQKAQIPKEKIHGLFDLILVSEVAYYWDDADLADAGAYFNEAIVDGGYLQLVHWTGETDYPKSGDEAVQALWQAMRSTFTVVECERHEKYRLDLWRKSSVKP